MFQSVFSRLHGLTPLTLTTCALTGLVLQADKASEKHSHAYLPIQFCQLLLNKRLIQKVLLTCCMTGLTQHTLKTLKQNPNQFR